MAKSKNVTRKKAKSTKGRQMAEKLSEKLPVLEPQPHGGALLRGRPPGFKGAGGRPPDLLKEIAAEKAFDRLQPLDDVAGGKAMRRIARSFDEHGKQIGFMEIEATPEMQHQLKAFELLAKLSGALTPGGTKAAPGGFDFEDGIVVIESRLVLGEDRNDN